jgi:uncharacterized protein YbcV (DUF1398 family)
MFTLDQIRAISQEGVEKKWSYPQLFEALKSIGVERYESNVLTHEIKYVGEGASLVMPPPDHWPRLVCASAYNEAELKTALKRVQNRETSYPEFLGQIAAAGVSFYRVDMKPRTVTYHGPGKSKLVEKIPPA